MSRRRPATGPLFLAPMLLAPALLTAWSPDVRAETGLYIGAGIGASSLQADLTPEGSVDVFDIDESDFAWKAFAGYNLDVPFIDFGVEAGYVNLGKPSAAVLGEEVGLDAAGWDAFAVGGVDVGPLALFAKLGVVAWDVEVSGSGIDLGNEDGTDLAFGVGARFGLGPVQIRGEAEFFEIDVIDSSYLLSASLVWQF